MNTLAQLLPTILVIFVVAFTSGIVQRLALNLFGVQNITNPGTKRFATAGIKSFVFTAMFAAGFAIIGSPYTIGTYLMLWASIGLIEYVWPTRT